jgi:deoxyribonucleoside regulator
MTESYKKNESVKVAHYYYKAGMTQDEIAKRMSMSRQRVNRILKKCLETGVVKIIIQEYEHQNIELETQLEKISGLKEVIAVECSPEERDDAIGIAASSYMERVLKDNDIIGFSRGRALSYLAKHLTPISRKNLTVTQLVGGLNASDSHINSDDIVRRSSIVLNAKPCFMYAPIILENKQLRDSLMNESFFSNVYNTMKSCTIALVGIGDMSKKSVFVHKNFIKDSELEILKNNKAVGEVCTHYFDKYGKTVNSGLNDRVIAIDYDSFKKIPIRVGVGGGPEKADAIVGAIMGGLINVLITDSDTAHYCLKSMS